MIHVAIGTDTYGAVRRVERTTIVTKFFMLQVLPIIPLESYYLVRLGRKCGGGVPLLASITQREIVGIPCRQINRLSVIVAYVRALGAIMLLFPATVFFFDIVMWLSDANFRPDEFARLVITVAKFVLVIGLVFTLPTYYLTFYVPSREAAIRRACARVLGVAADPARVRVDVAREITRQVSALFEQREISNSNEITQLPNSFDRDVLDLALVRTRARLGEGGASDARESETDDLLRAIEHVPVY